MEYMVGHEWVMGKRYSLNNRVVTQPMTSVGVSCGGSLCVLLESSGAADSWRNIVGPEWGQVRLLINRCCGYK